MDIKRAINIVGKSGADVVDSCGRTCKDLPIEFGRYKIDGFENPVIIVKDVTCMATEERFRDYHESIVTYKKWVLLDLIQLLVDKSSCGLGKFYDQTMDEKWATRFHLKYGGPCFQFPLVNYLPTYGVRFNLKVDEDDNVITVLEGYPEEPNVNDIERLFRRGTKLQEVHFTPYLQLNKGRNLLELILELQMVKFAD